MINKRKNIIVKHSSVIIENYELGDCYQLEKMLSIYDDLYHKVKPYYFYEEDKKELRIPRGVNIPYLESFFKVPVNVVYESDDYEKVSYKLKTFPRNELQQKSISFLLGENEFNYTKNQSQLALNLDTGDGKTYSVIAALALMNMKSIIITNIDRIKIQWHESFLHFTTLDENHIYNIDSSSKMKKILDGKEDLRKVKVFLVNHRSIFSFAKKYGWEKVSELFKFIKVGVKVYDEAHLEFKNILKIDYYTNTFKTFYLTANFEKSDRIETTIYRNAFASVLKFGADTRKDKERHIIYMPYIFTSNPDYCDKIKIKTKKGFDRNRYSDYHREKHYMFDICTNLIDRYKAKNKDTSVMILFSKIDMVDLYVERIRKEFPEYKISALHSKIDPSEKMDIDDSDIIVSTPRSAGVGTDIRGLGCVIMTEPYSSTITANQVSGRLRYLGDNKDSFYIELIDRGFESVYKMYINRLKFLKKKCKEIIVMRDNNL